MKIEHAYKYDARLLKLATEYCEKIEATEITNIAVVDVDTWRVMYRDKDKVVRATLFPLPKGEI